MIEAEHLEIATVLLHDIVTVIATQIARSGGPALKISNFNTAINSLLDTNPILSNLTSVQKQELLDTVLENYHMPMWYTDYGNYHVVCTKIVIDNLPLFSLPLQ